MMLRETIKKLLREEMDGKSKKDYSKVIEQLLESLIERKKHIICDIEVTAPWNRETIEPGKSFEHYKVLITFIGGFGTKYFPITQSVHIIYDKIIDEIWQTIYGFMGFPVDIYTKKVESCKNIEKDKKSQVMIEGLYDTSWENDEGDKITLIDLLNATEDIPVERICVEDLKPHLLTWDSDKDEIKKIDKADLQYPILIFVEDNGEFISIIDGHHRAQKAVRNGLETIKAKIIPINSLPKYIRKVFSHMGRQEEIKEGELTERCWKGYTQKGMKTMFGKRYPNCVKKKKVNEATIKPHSVRYFTKEEIASFEKILNNYMSKYEWWKGITIDGLTYSGNRKDIDLSADLNVDEEWGANQWRNTFYSRPFPGNDEPILLGEILDGNTVYEFREDLANIFIFTFGLPLSKFPVNEIRVRFIPNTDEEKYAVIEITKPIARMEPKYYFQEVPFWKTKEDMIYINKGSSGKKTISTKNIKVLKTFSDRNSPEMKKYLEKLRNQEK